ncbi:Uma2 family endonuclease [Clostridium sp.]|uniref:Uma2 family endonuclease n=1 Tax=Clostridium sp. TaxID=1506 RepID=UPI003992BB6C
MALLNEKSSYTLIDYEKLCETTKEGKVEFNNGGILLSSNSSITHNIIIQNISKNINDKIDTTKCRAFSEMIEIAIDKENGEQYRYKPDIFVICKNREGSFERKGQSFTSVPLLVFEVVSKSNFRDDIIIKRDSYARIGIKEYNLVHQDGRIEQLELSGEYYITKKLYEKDDVYNSFIFDNLKIKLQDIFDGIEDFI